MINGPVALAANQQLKVKRHLAVLLQLPCTSHEHGNVRVRDTFHIHEG